MGESVFLIIYCCGGNTSCCCVLGFASIQGKSDRTTDVKAPLLGATAEATSSTQSAEQVQIRNMWVDSVLGGLDDHRPCPYCLMGPCITVGQLTSMHGSCAPDITNHTKRHKDYRRFWKSLKDRGLWQHELYINRKTAAGLSAVELRELMPQCVLDDTRK